jgi:methylated-DNA-[protein]-cysteine S-methyltransferase
MAKASKRQSTALLCSNSREKKVAFPAEAVAHGCFVAPFGNLVIVASDTGIRSISIGPPAAIDHQRSSSSSSSSSSRAHGHIQQAQEELGQYFARQRTAFTLPLDAHGTEFQLLAWAALRCIPFGSTSSYAQVRSAGGTCCS